MALDQGAALSQRPIFWLNASLLTAFSSFFAAV
jgi:hypothetical protein